MGVVLDGKICGIYKLFFFFFGFSCLPTLAILNGFQQGIQFEKVVFFAVC